jgi:hypothetical protein
MNVIWEVGKKFHWNFQVGVQAHLFNYKDVNLGWTTKV